MEAELKENAVPDVPPSSPEAVTEIIREAEVIVEKIQEIAKIVEVVDTVIESNSWSCLFFDWLLSVKTRLHSLAKPAAPSNKESN